MIRRKLDEFCWKMQSVIAPKLKYSQDIYETTLASYAEPDCTWLDLGCGHHLLSPWRLEEEKSLVKKPGLIVGFDFDWPSLKKHRTINRRVRGDISALPFPDESFDLVTSNMVFEHLDNPSWQLQEIHRVLKPEGRLIFHTPNVYGYTTILARMVPEPVKDKVAYLLDGRSEDDVFPTHYKINTTTRIKRAASSAGFEVKRLRMICSAAQFAIVPPLALAELVWIRLLLSEPFKPLRTNMIAILEKS